MVTENVDINAQDTNGVSSLMMAAFLGREDVADKAQALISRGADVNVKAKSEQQRLVHTTAEDAEVCRGRTCLDHSLRSSAPSAVEFSVPMLRGLI